MNRRNFLRTTSITGALLTSGVSFAGCNSSKVEDNNEVTSIGGLSIKEHRDELWQRLFEEYLPFWEHGGYDEKYGGFICHLDKDGIPVDDEKNIWYQGRGIWVYSFLYNNIKKDPKYLEIAKQARNFMVNKMYANNGKWLGIVHRDGAVIKGIDHETDIYGWLFAANGLAEYYKISKDDEDLKLIKESIHAAVESYDSEHYLKGTKNEGLRFQGHSMIFLRLLTQFLSHHKDEELEKLLEFHKNKIMNDFYHPEYRISNEELNHDYSRIKGKDDKMFLGHSLETQWMVMDLALRRNDKDLYKKARDNFRRYLMMGWDHNFDGWGSEFYYVLQDYPLQKVYQTKTMWSHTEILNGCLMIYEHEKAMWARELYDETWDYVKKYFSRGIPAWEQAVDRFGKPKSRANWGINPMRRGNYHQPRYLMLAILRLNRMIEKQSSAT